MLKTNKNEQMRMLGLVCAVALCAGSAVAQTADAAKSASLDGSQWSSSRSLSIAEEGLPEGGGAAAFGGGSAMGGGHQHNYGSSNWSNKLAIELGAGFSAPTPETSTYLTWGGNFTVGGGYRFNNAVQLLAEYQFISDKLPGALIAETGANGGHAHIWSFTLAPVVDLTPKRKNGIYVTGGGGFYRKVTAFTDPEETEYCDYYYCEVGTTNQVVGSFSSNQGGLNGGLGLYHKLGGVLSDGKSKVFIEARYLYLFTPAVNGSANGLGVATIAKGTQVIPVTIGFRF